MSAQQKLSGILSDDEMRLHLERGDMLVFQGMGGNWEEMEEQIERLGFGNQYLVLRGDALSGERTKAIPARAVQ